SPPAGTTAGGVCRLAAPSPRSLHWGREGPRGCGPGAAPGGAAGGGPGPLDVLTASGPPAPPVESGQGLGGSMLYTGGTTGKPKGALRGTVNPEVSAVLMGALDLSVPGHTHLAAGAALRFPPLSFPGHTRRLVT